MAALRLAMPPPSGARFPYYAELHRTLSKLAGTGFQVAHANSFARVERQPPQQTSLSVPPGNLDSIDHQQRARVPRSILGRGTETHARHA